ncbi:uncharacterized protein LOC143080457 [Mytilus galloprovincialis]|uniref:uncharacterized protein LOC143080457 n=1 Tax=Mytilus galloprovincialis TaxID=29158 RepID=UPI003F7B7E79
MKLQIAVLCFLFLALASAKRHRRGKDKMRCRYERGKWGDCDLTSNTVSMTLNLKQGSPSDCVPTQTKSIPCEHLEQIKAWKAKKFERKAKFAEHREHKNRLKKHKKGLKEKFGMGCRFDVSVSECNKETNMVTKTFTVTGGDPATCQPESIAYSCELHEKLMRWKQKRQDKRKSKNHKRKEWKNKRHERRQNRRERLSNSN